MRDIGPGQMVRCVSKFRDKQTDPHGTIYPVVGSVYRVRGVKHIPEGLGLFLVEIVNTKHLWGNGVFGEANFSFTHFVPIDDSALDVFREAIRNVLADKVTAFRSKWMDWKPGKSSSNSPARK